MKKLLPLKYTLAFSLYVVAGISFSLSGYWTYSLVIYGYIIIPFIELLYSPNFKNIIERESMQSKMYDYLIYMMVPLHYLSLSYFFYSIYQSQETYEIVGRILTMGTLCGHSINIAHELGHRGRKFEQNLAKILLLPIFREVAKKHGMKKLVITD